MLAVPGVAAVTPVGQHLEMKGESGLGLRQIDGVEFDHYSAITKIRIVEGNPLPEAGDVVVVDVKYAAARKTKVGDRINLLDRDFRVTGIYEPETGAWIMIPLQTMQESLGVAGKCSMLMVKCANPGEQEAVARRIGRRDPDARVAGKLDANPDGGRTRLLDLRRGDRARERADRRALSRAARRRAGSGRGAQL